MLAIPLVGGGDLAGVLELDPGARAGFPADERELAEVLAVLLTLSLGNAAALPRESARLPPRVGTFAAERVAVPPSVAIPLAGTVQRHVDRGR